MGKVLDRFCVKESLKLKVLAKLLVMISLVFVASSAKATPQEFLEETEKDYPLRSIGQLEVKNLKGDIQIQGWSLDKIRIHLKKRVVAETSAEAKLLLGRITYRLRSRDANDEDIEISNQYASELSIGERLKESGQAGTQMDFIIMAPSRLNLQVWSTSGKITVKNWNANLTIRTREGAVLAEGIKAAKTSVFCKTCLVSLKQIKGELHFAGEQGAVVLEEVDGKKIYSELGLGSTSLKQIKGEQLYLGKEGSIIADGLEGKITFQTKAARSEFKNISGSLSGSSTSGDIVARITSWKPSGQSLIESKEGNIRLTFPRRLASDVDLWSVYGKTQLDYTLMSLSQETLPEQKPPHHWVGRLGDGGDLIKVHTERGDLHFLRAAF